MRSNEKQKSNMLLSIELRLVEAIDNYQFSLQTPLEDLNRLFNKRMKLIWFYSSLIMFLTRNRGEASLVLVLVSHINEQLLSLTEIQNPVTIDHQDILNLNFTFHISRSVHFLTVLYEIFLEIESQKWTYFKDEKREILNFLEENFKEEGFFLHKPLNQLIKTN